MGSNREITTHWQGHIMRDGLAPVAERFTRKMFREEMNAAEGGRVDAGGKQSHKGANGRFTNRKRAYGDYLWAQDREMFESDYYNRLSDMAKAEGQ